ncbi:MAG: hypothetical protein ACW99G_18710 [Candidatus Thorarchaeota archaeon]|jgi:hypothetical protein
MSPDDYNLTKFTEEIESLDVEDILKHVVDIAPKGNAEAWSQILLLLLQRRPEVFDNTEFLKSILGIIEEWFSHVGVLDIFSEDLLDEILMSMLDSDNDNIQRLLDTILRLGHDVIWWVKDDNIKEKLASNPVLQEAIARSFEKEIWYEFRAIIELLEFPDFAQSTPVIESVEKQKENILKEVRDGFSFSMEAGFYYPWDIFQLSRYPSLNKEIMKIMDQMKPYIAHCCYREGMEHCDRSGRYETLTPSEFIGKIVHIPLFLQDPDIQLGIARVIRSEPVESWTSVLESEDFMRSNPLILAALQAPINKDSIKSLVRQIRESKVPLFMIQEVLAYKQFRGKADVMKEINKRIPEIVSMIEIAKPNTDEDDWKFGLISLILYLVEDKNLLEYPQIRRAIEKRLVEFHQSTGYYFYQDELYVDVLTKLLLSEDDTAVKIWKEFPHATSISFVVEEGLRIYTELPHDFLESGRIDWGQRVDLVNLIQMVGKTGGDNAKKILIILLYQLIEQVQSSTYVHAKIAGGYDNFTPDDVEFTVLGWIITELRDNHDATVVKPLIDVLDQTSDYTRVGLSSKIFRILSHYLSSDEITELKKKFGPGGNED